MRLVSLIFFYIFTLMYTFNASIGDPPHNFDKSLSREDSHRKLEERENYIRVTFHRDVSYNTGFKNEYRNDIDYIYNHYNGDKYDFDEELDIHADSPIDIYFTKPVRDMNFFFAWGTQLINRDKVTDILKDSKMEFLKSVDFSHFDASELTTLDQCFLGSKNYESITFGNFNATKLDKAHHMFGSCGQMEYLNLSTFSSPNIYNTYAWFAECGNLKVLDLSNVNFLKVFSAQNLFTSANNLEYIVLNNSLFSDIWINSLQELAKRNVFFCQPNQTTVTGPNVKSLCCNYDMNNKRCSSENYITIYYKQSCNYTNGFYNEYRKKVRFLNMGSTILIKEGFEITKGTKLEITLENDIETLEHFFDSRYDENMNYVESIDFSHFDSSFLINCKNLFYGCTSLKSVNLSKFNTSNVINMEGMFQGCNSLLSVDLSNFNKSKITDTSFMFSNCSSLVFLDISNFDMTNIKNHTSMFNDINPKLKYLNVYNTNKPDIFLDSSLNKINDLFVCQNSEIISNTNSHNVCCTYNLELEKCEVTSYIELYYNKNVSYKTGFKNAYRKSLSNIINDGTFIFDIKEFNVSAGTKVELQFYYPPTDFESFFDANYDENMHYIEKIDFFNFDSSSITNIKNLFNGCDSLKYANLSNFNPTKLNTANNIFKGCSSLIFLDIANLNLSSIIEEEDIFDKHDNLRYINLYNATDKNNMISGSKIDKIKNLIACHHDDIILSSNSHNVCCDFDYETNECSKHNYIKVYYK